MARRRYRKRRSIGKIVARRTGSKMAGNVAQTAMAGYRLAKRIARLVNVEVKHFDVIGSEQSNYSPNIIDLCDPVQGHDQDERTGDSIKPLHLTIRGYITPGTDFATPMRIIIFRYKDESGNPLTAGDILQTIGSADIVNSPKPWDKRYHSKILYDKIHFVGLNSTTSGTGTVAGIPHIKKFSYTTKLFGHINWSDSTSTQEGGGLYMLITSASATDAAAPKLTYYSRVTYTDN